MCAQELEAEAVKPIVHQAKGTSMQARLVTYALTSALLLAATLAAAEPTTVRTFAVADHGSLQLSAPKSWPVEMRPAAGSALPTIAFGPGEGATYRVLITPLSMARKAEPVPAPAVKQMVERAAQDAAAQSVEASLTVKELKSGAHVGYYFSATDRAPNPDEYKYMTQGMFGLGEILLSFTILTNDGHGTVVPAALNMIKTAVTLKDL